MGWDTISREVRLPLVFIDPVSELSWFYIPRCIKRIQTLGSALDFVVARAIIAEIFTLKKMPAAYIAFGIWYQWRLSTKRWNFLTKTP
jgi:MFS family permease